MEKDREVIKTASTAAPLVILASLILLNYVINGLPYIPDSWTHIAHSETLLRTGYLFGPSPNPSMVSYNYKWPTVNLLLALSQSVLGLGPIQSFYVVNILASLSIIPFILLVRRLTGSDMATLITGLLFAVLSVKLLVDSSVMKETAAQYPFYAYMLTTYMALIDRKHLRQNLLVMVLTFIAILFAHHFTLLMALAYSFIMTITVLMSNYLSGNNAWHALYVAITVIALGLLTYYWYVDYLRAYTVTTFVTPGLISTPILIAILLIDYVTMRRGSRILIYATLAILALMLISMFSTGKFLPYVLEGFNRAVVLSSTPYVLPILIAVLYLALYGFERPVVAITTVLSLAILLYVLLMGNNPLELLFLSKSLDFVMPFLLIPTALMITSAVRHRLPVKALAYVLTAALMISLPIFAVLTLYTYSLPTSSTLTVYRLIDYEEFNAINGLIPRNSTLYSSISYESMIMFMTGINTSDPTTYLIHGEAPQGLLLLTERNLRVGFLYGSGYSMVSIPKHYLLNILMSNDLVYSSRTLWLWETP
ncbi:hypothetical protein [Vulcanisaeta distributa]|uniref:Glycosyltransferase RgtA/B/C/D-like domain-containing protein n=1 Tax=Vulcanisaeta distributa (strain DSM 14429 / JCM 11212 / NBRC 100878 / IC-017) TaxID=572478 RepID=E1QU37_VULDI|nr:hypothetical protein [Vulcanisaeta distributa]ADN49834.1 hypothetical protein Vdis_0433 [Vulcanisaeta distributa DSM 14429]